MKSAITFALPPRRRPPRPSAKVVTAAPSAAPDEGRLRAYREKRDFTRTAEPSGQQEVAPSTRPRFVIQKHAARRLHYDFRLELNGTFKSWAVARGPSLDPADKRLAVEVEDHPLEYGDFEGTIPQGQYGGGTVQIWDRGYWTPEGDPEEGLAKGDLKFTLHGTKLHGGCVLVRMKGDRFGGKRTNWLLIKHHDAYAGSAADTARLLTLDKSVASGRTMQEIAAGKGRGPRPFMLKGRKPAPANAVWDTNHGATAEMRATVAKSGKAREAKSGPR
jgi:bifunctional non-homologous end joining protein LigD